MSLICNEYKNRILYEDTTQIIIVRIGKCVNYICDIEFPGKIRNIIVRFSRKFRFMKRAKKDIFIY